RHPDAVDHRLTRRTRRLTRHTRRGAGGEIPTGASAFGSVSAGAARTGRAALECAALVFGETAPHARVLAGLEGVLQADLGDGAGGADGLRLLDLVDSRTGVPDGEEQFGVDGQAGRFVAPVH